MIPTYINMEGEIPLNEPVISIDAGGTNFRVAVIYFDKNRKLVIEDFKNYPMPGSLERFRRRNSSVPWPIISSR